MYLMLSLGLGLVSWGLAAAALPRKRSWVWCAVSLMLCILALLLPFFEVNFRVNNGDFAAIEDTFPAILFAAETLTVLDLGLNLTAILRKIRKT